ncbi:hypothetical protein [Streptomyces sp. ISL-94]|nr:hypothetical protein [Streptomyces sp. ISL-94]MBT2480696.1 hypothetical protein [Streptomyces sp. ISL-94]
MTRSAHGSATRPSAATDVPVPDGFAAACAVRTGPTEPAGHSGRPVA